MFYRFIKELKGYGVKAEIIPPKPQIIEVSSDEDMYAKYKLEMISEPPELSFDFTENDSEVLIKHGVRCLEEQKKVK